ncbi:MAG: hypothetical protein PHG48_00860 [Eubacteriales bacterium]|nr:hypothetical protein [Eubacteriales bacterium]
MINEIFCIPQPFYIAVDDVGWWCGKDDSGSNGPSRSGIRVRDHCPDDYRALALIGKSLGTRILCGFIIGEWDRKNILAHVRNSNKYGPGWDNAAKINAPLMDTAAREARDIVNDSQDSMEIAIHGLMHMYWDDSGRMLPGEFHQKTGKPSLQKPSTHSGFPVPSSRSSHSGSSAGTRFSDFTSFANSARYTMTNPDVVREHLDAFFEIYAHNGFKGNITTFLPPCFHYIYSGKPGSLSSILAEYGIKYVTAPFSWMDSPFDENPASVGVENGIITVDRQRDLARWNEVGTNPPGIIRPGCFGMHWINLLAADSSRNKDIAEKWISYFSRYKGLFDIIIAKDSSMASSQSLYCRYLKASEIKVDGRSRLKLELDYAAIDALHASGLSQSLFINVRRPFTPVADKDLEILPYDSHEAYATYTVSRRIIDSATSPGSIKIIRLQ